MYVYVVFVGGYRGKVLFRRASRSGQPQIYVSKSFLPEHGPGRPRAGKINFWEIFCERNFPTALWGIWSPLWGIMRCGGFWIFRQSFGKTPTCTVRVYFRCLKYILWIRDGPQYTLCRRFGLGLNSDFRGHGQKRTSKQFFGPVLDCSENSHAVIVPVPVLVRVFVLSHVRHFVSEAPELYGRAEAVGGHRTSSISSIGDPSLLTTV